MVRNMLKLLANKESCNLARTGWLDTLRGAAALLVFVSHLRVEVTENFMFIVGRVGVVLFFLISGYLTYESMAKRNRKQYMFNRFVRMYPVYWILLLPSWLLYDFKELSVCKLIANMTLFEQFIGFGIIIGASWMMPIQICFFGVICVTGAVSDKKIELAATVFGIMAIMLGFLRRISEKPFPTAFPLLIMIGYIGLMFYCYDNIRKKSLVTIFCIFEITLLIAAFLSYENWWAYIISYNAGILFFGVAKHYNTKMIIFEKLGEIGFPFFLGAELIYTALCKLGICGHQEYMAISDCLIQAGSAVLLAVAITYKIEKPLLRWSKEIEKKLY